MTPLETVADKCLASLNELPSEAIDVDITIRPTADHSQRQIQATEWLLSEASQNLKFFADKAKRAAQILERLGTNDPETQALLATSGKR